MPKGVHNSPRSFNLIDMTGQTFGRPLDIDPADDAVPIDQKLSRELCAMAIRPVAPVLEFGWHRFEAVPLTENTPDFCLIGCGHVQIAG